MNVSDKQYDEATNWLARLRADDVSETDHLNFAHWLIEHPSNKPAFDAMLQLWEDLGISEHVKPDPSVGVPRVAKD